MYTIYQNYYIKQLSFFAMCVSHNYIQYSYLLITLVVVIF